MEPLPRDPLQAVAGGELVEVDVGVIEEHLQGDALGEELEFIAARRADKLVERPPLRRLRAELLQGGEEGGGVLSRLVIRTEGVAHVMEGVLRVFARSLEFDRGGTSCRLFERGLAASLMGHPGPLALFEQDLPLRALLLQCGDGAAPLLLRCGISSESLSRLRQGEPRGCQGLIALLDRALELLARLS